MAEIKSRLEKMASFSREELKLEATLKAEEEKRNKLSALEAKIKSFERQSDCNTHVSSFTFNQSIKFVYD